MTSAPAQLAAPAPLPRAFWTYWGGMTTTALGDAVLSIILPFLAVALQGHGAGTGAVGSLVLAGSLPRFFGPLLGSLADRLAPRPLFIATTCARAGLVTLLGFLAQGDHLTLGLLLVAAFSNALLATLTYAAGSALTPRIVPADRLALANSLSSGAMMGAPLLGYGLGGILLHVMGTGGALSASVPLILGLGVASLVTPALPGPTGTGQLNVLNDLRAGLHVIRSSPLLLALLTLSFLLNAALSVLNVRVPLHMLEVGRGAPDYAVFEMLNSGGVLLGILLTAPLTARLSVERVIGVGRVLLTAGMAGFILRGVPAWWTAALAFGAGLGLLEVSVMTRAQQIVPRDVLGRTFGAFMGVNAVGLSLGALIAAWPCPTPALMLGVTLLLLTVTLAWLLVPPQAQGLEPVH